MKKLKKQEVLDFSKDSWNRYLRLKKSHRVAVAVAVFSFLWIFSGVVLPSAQEVEDVYQAKDLRVRVKNIVNENTKSEVKILGRTNAYSKVTLKAEITGTVSNTDLKEGSKVEKGQLLLSISKEDRKARLEEAKATVAQKRLEYNAARKLVKKGFNSKVKFSQAKAAWEQARANLKTAELNYKRTSIKAPFSGIFDKRLVEKGDFVSKGTPLALLVALDPIVIKAEVSEKIINSIELGSKAKARLVTGEVITGEISYVSAVADESSRTFSVEIQAKNEDSKIVEGMTAEAMIPLRQRMAVKISPAILTLNDKGIVGVKTVDKDDIVSFYPVDIVKHNDNGMWVSGLPDKQRIITAGQEFVKSGAKVIPVLEKETKE